MTNNSAKSAIRLSIILLILSGNLLLWAQSGNAYQYFYDDLGQLTKMIDSAGTVIEYVYDPVGNILQIKRSTVAPGTIAVFSFTPQRGGPGQTVTIQGQGFGATPGANIVQFNGAPATVTSASPTTLVVTVPVGATTGPISVTVSGQTATSTTNFTVLPIPFITNLSRKSALLGATFPNSRFPSLTVTGINLTGSTFALAPAINPQAVTFGIPAIDPTGSLATMSLTVGTSATGTFALVATNGTGSSSSTPTPANRLTIVDPHSTADTDGDGVPDAIEAIYGTDPLDPNSFPIIPSLPGQAQSPAFTVLNQSAQPVTPTTLEAESPAFTLLNGSPAPSNHEAESPAFTLNNTVHTTSVQRSRTVAQAQVQTLRGPGRTPRAQITGRPSKQATLHKTSKHYLKPATHRPSPAKQKTNKKFARKSFTEKNSTASNRQPGVIHVNQN